MLGVEHLYITFHGQNLIRISKDPVEIGDIEYNSQNIPKFTLRKMINKLWDELMF